MRSGLRILVAQPKGGEADPALAHCRRAGADRAPLDGRAAPDRRIRASLLAALRSVVLWRPLGGRPRHLLLERRAIIESAQQLLGRSLAAV